MGAEISDTLGIAGIYHFVVIFLDPTDFYPPAISKTIEIIKILNFRRKSDFHPKKDINEALSGKAEKYLGPMTHRRRKSEGYIDHDYNKVYN